MPPCHQVEVDAVIETPDGRVVGIEVKSGATVRTEDLAGLRNLASRLGDRFVAGYVLYTGQQTLPSTRSTRVFCQTVQVTTTHAAR